MPKRKKPEAFQYRGLDLDWQPFDNNAFQTIISETEYSPVVEGSALDALRKRMNNAAISLDHDLQLGSTPTAKAEKDMLEQLHSHVQRLRPLLKVSFERDVGLAPDDSNPSVSYGILKILAQEMAARLTGEKPITHLTERNDASTDSPDREDGSAAGDPAEYDPACAEFFFGAKDPNDILVLFGNILALAEDAARSALEQRSDAPVAERSTPERTFVFALIPIYCELFGRGAGSSVVSKNRKPGATHKEPQRERPEPGGPMIRFLVACLGHVAYCGAKQVKPETLRKYVTEYNKDAARD